MDALDLKKNLPGCCSLICVLYTGCICGDGAQECAAKKCEKIISLFCKQCTLKRLKRGHAPSKMVSCGYCGDDFCRQCANEQLSQCVSCKDEVCRRCIDFPIEPCHGCQDYDEITYYYEQYLCIEDPDQ